MRENQDYTPELGETIATMIEKNCSYPTIENATGISRTAIFRWIRDEKDFLEKVSRARLTQADVIDDDINQVIDKTLNLELDPNIARVVIEAMKWRASKKNPKVYGEKTHVEHEVKLSLPQLVEQSLALENSGKKGGNLLIDVTPVKDENLA